MSNYSRLSCFSVLSLIALASACDESRTSGAHPGGPGGPGGTGGTGGIEGPAAAGPCTKLDLLFVIDDSGSMKEEQGNLAVNFPKFISLLEAFKTSAGSELDYRIGVTTTGRTVTYGIALPPPFPQLPPMTEYGDDGKLRAPAECGMTRPWIERSDADVTTTFSCVAQVGTGGPSLEMPLNAVKMALVDRVEDGQNDGFLRPDALLAVVILTDENDCSREDDNFNIENDSCEPAGPNIQPVSKYLDLLDGIKGDRGRWAAAVIAGPGPSTCASAFGEAAPAFRLKSFVDDAGDQAIFSSICAGDLTLALKDALGKFTAACESFTVL
jgi:hypothetical protein